MAKILLIEDDPLMINLYQRTFTKKNYEVRVASNGEEGLKQAEDFLPDVVLLDIMMPGMDGFQVLEKLKAGENTSNVSVIILSNIAGSEDEQKALDLGATKYLIKSEHDPSEVVGFVEEVVGVTPEAEADTSDSK